LSDELKSKLTQLKELHESGLLTDAELAEHKRATIANIMATTPAGRNGPATPLAGATTVQAENPPPPVAGATTVSPAEQIPERLGSYRVLGVLGAGGMGTVLRARHDKESWAQRQGGDVAIKVVHTALAADEEFQERFFSEAAMGRRLQHPGLARVYDVISEGPWLGTILELIEGEDLGASIKPGGLSVSEALSLLRPLAEALDHLHAEGVVHRDLKPGNVKVRSDGRPVLLDLGIAKDLEAKDGGHTRTMTAMGTSAWMAPEQADRSRSHPPRMSTHLGSSRTHC